MKTHDKYHLIPLSKIIYHNDSVKQFKISIYININIDHLICESFS